MNEPAGREAFVFVDPDAPRCDACGSGDTTHHARSSAPFSRMAPLWIAAILFALAVYVWFGTREAGPASRLFPNGDRRIVGNIMLWAAAAFALFCALLSLAQAPEETGSHYQCLDCGNTFPKPRLPR